MTLRVSRNRLTYKAFLLRQLQCLWLAANSRPEFYSDFSAPADWAKVRAAIAWNSDQALAIHAARLFLGCTTAHSGNILVDTKGNLLAIDFEFRRETEGEELKMLFENVRPGTRAFKALSGVASLTTVQIFNLFDGTPNWFRSPMGNSLDSALYFVKRHDLWKSLFQERGT